MRWQQRRYASGSVFRSVAPSFGLSSVRYGLCFFHLGAARVPSRTSLGHWRSMNRALLFLTVFLLSACASVEPKPQATCFHRDVAIEKDIGFCQAVRSGNT